MSNRGCHSKHARPFIAGFLLCATAIEPIDAWPQDLELGGPVPIVIRRPVTKFAFSQGFSIASSEKEAGTTESSNSRQRISFRFGSGGYVYHPALLDFSWSIRPSFNRNEATVENEKIAELNSDYVGYDLSTTWLKLKPYRLDLSASKSRSETSNPLQIDTINEAENQSGRFNLQLGETSTRVNFGKSQTIASGFFSQEMQRDFWSVYSKKESEKARTQLTINRQKSERSFGGRTSVPAEYLTAVVNNQYQFDGGAKLLSNLLYRNFNTGPREISNLNGISRLMLSHPWGFSSNWSASLTSGGQGGERRTGSSWSGTLGHQLYENLATRATFRKSSFDDSRESENRTFSSNYNRRIPWGHIRFGGGKAATSTMQFGQSTPIEINDEAQSFDAGTVTVVLENTGIDPGSILVTDITGLVPYQQGIDYAVEAVGSNILITREEFGAIGESATVLVSYELFPEEDIQHESHSNYRSAGLGLGEKLDFFYSESEAVQERNYLDREPVQTTRDAFRYGATLKARNRSTTLEFEDISSPQTNLERRSLRQTYSFPVAPGSVLRTTAGYSELLLRDTGEIRKSLAVSGNMSIRVGMSGRLNIRGALRKYTSGQSKQMGWGINSSYGWRYGAWSLGITAAIGSASNAYYALESSNEQVRKHFSFSASRTFR